MLREELQRLQEASDGASEPLTHTHTHTHRRTTTATQKHGNKKGFPRRVSNFVRRLSLPEMNGALGWGAVGVWRVLQRGLSKRK